MDIGWSRTAGRHRRPMSVVGLLTVALLLTGCVSGAAQVTASTGKTTATTATTTTGTTATTATTTSPKATSPKATSPKATSPKATSPTATAPASPSSAAAHQLPAGVAPEASGLIRSADGTFYTVDDGTGTGELIALRANGSLVARVRVAGMSAENAEALTSGPCSVGDPKSGVCFFVGDVGNQRDTVTIYRIPEPTGPPWFATSTAWTYDYPDGRHNAEAMFLAPDGQLVIITKSAVDKSGKVPPHRIYRAPRGGGRLTLVGTFSPPKPAVALQSLLTGTVVTDASYDGHRVLLLTYDEVLEYTEPRPGADPAGFPSWPHRNLPMPDVPQAEGITGLPDGCGYAVASEAGPFKGPGWLAVESCPR